MFWVRELAKRLIEIPGVVAVTLGDSLGPMQRESEWAFGLYYRGAIRAEDVRALGFEGILVEPGQWGRLANGGGQLMVEGQPVDLRYRKLDVVQHWIDEAEVGNYDIDWVEGYLADMATYGLAGELALGEVLAGDLPRPEFPDALRPSRPRTLARQRGHLARYRRYGCAAPRRCLVRGAAGEGSHRGRTCGVRGARRVGADREGHRSRGRTRRAGCG